MAGIAVTRVGGDGGGWQDSGPALEAEWIGTP